jgi:hypothetical protein
MFKIRWLFITIKLTILNKIDNLVDRSHVLKGFENYCQFKSLKANCYIIKISEDVA